MWTLYACLMGIFRVGHVDPLCTFYEKYTELVMWTLYTGVMKIFRVGHVDPLYRCYENIQSWSCGSSMHV